MATTEQSIRWLILAIKPPAAPPRHRVAVWRELRKVGPCRRGRASRLAELEEEEQSLERLRRWHRGLTARDVFGAPEAAAAAMRLKNCAALCEDYSERVFAALHATDEDWS